MVKTYYDGSHKIYLIDFGRVLYIDDFSSHVAKVVNTYTENLFNEPPLFIIEEGWGPRLIPSITPDTSVFSEDYVQSLILLALSVDYAYNKIYFDWAESSKMNRIYVTYFNGNSMVNIANALNVYYNLANFSGYKRLDPTQNYDRSAADIAELATCLRKNANDPVSLLQPETASPERIQFKAKAARSAQKEAKKKRRVLSEGEEEDGSSFPAIKGFPSMGSEESESSGRPPVGIFRKPPGLFDSESGSFRKDQQQREKKSGGKKSKKRKKGGRKRKTKKLRRACF
jgi:hypothetical protein